MAKIRLSKLLFILATLLPSDIHAAFQIVSAPVPLRKGIKANRRNSQAQDDVSSLSCRPASVLFSQKQHNNREALETQRDEALAALERMDVLEETIKTKSSDEASLSSVAFELVNMEENVKRLSAELILPPKGLSMEEYEAAIIFFVRLPYAMRAALCEALEVPEAVSDWTRTPEIVSRLYEERITLTPKRLQDSLKAVKASLENRDQTSFVISSSDSRSSPQEEAQAFVTQLLDGKSQDEVRRENYVKQHLGRVTRKEDTSVTEEELKVLIDSLDSSTFVLQGKPEPIPGGYIMRGRNAKPNGEELIEALDSKLPTQWSAQVSLMPDFTEESAGGINAEPILVLLKSDFSPTTNQALLAICTASAMATALLFGVGCFGANEFVAQQLQDSAAVGEYGGVEWFNGLLAELLLPFIAIQGAHELGHFLIARRDQIKMSVPTLLPFWILPFMGAQTQIKTSPKNLTSLFDFAFLGPFLGFLASIAFLLLGLQETLVADASIAQYFPSLPVSVLQLSTLGGSIVDAAYGGSGMVTLQSASATVPLHPFAIAGFCGLMISALEMLPLGSTDGGRISLALFGRPGHSVVGGATWFLLLCSTLFLDQHDLLLGAWVVNNIAQNDMEVPCRDETESIDLVRSVAVFGLWFVAILALTPMS